MMRTIRLLLALLVLLLTGAAHGQTLYYIHPDHLGTPRLIADEAGTTVWRWDNREPFGLSAPNEDADGNGQPLTFNLRFPGQYYDRETGTFYNGFRDYDPQTGRYIQSDPIGLDGGINTYGYVGGNPNNRIDPFGLQFGPGIGSGLGGSSSGLGAGAGLLGGGQTPGGSDNVSGDPGFDEAAGFTPSAAPWPSGPTWLENLIFGISVEYPDRPRTKGNVRCNCRCFANTQAGGPSDTSAIGSGEGRSHGEAQREAEKNAKRSLGCQAEHCECACIDSKGSKSKTGGR